MNAPVVTPLTLANEDLLQTLETGSFATSAELARHLGRDKSNLAKTMKSLAEAGVIDAGQLALTPAGEATLQALRGQITLTGIAAGGVTPATAEPAPEGFAMLRHAQIFPDPLNPRKHFDEEALQELADSIAQDDLLENLVVRVGETEHGGDVTSSVPLHRLVAGERRWRAIRILIRDGRWPEDKPVPCKVIAIDDAAHRRIALVENLQRKDLRPIDEAQALKELMAIEKLGTSEIAKQIGFTQRFVQQRLQLLDLPPIKQVELQEGKLTIEAARQEIQRINQRAAEAKEKILAPDELLAVAEVIDACAYFPVSPPGWYYGDKPIAVGHRGLEDGEVLRRLVDRNVLSLTKGWRDDPRNFIRLGYRLTVKDVEAQLPGFRGKDRQRVFLAQRYKVVGPDEAQRLDDTWRKLSGQRGEYATWALNEPFCEQPDPALVEAAEAYAAQEQERHNEELERNFEKRRKEEEAKETEVRGQVLLAKVRQLEADFPKFVGFMSGDASSFSARFEELLTEFNMAGPYTLQRDGAREDTVICDGQHAPMRASGAELEARRRLLCIAMNFAAGLPIFSGEPVAFGEPETPPAIAGMVAEDQDEFTRWVSGCLQDDLGVNSDEGHQMAVNGLAALLAEVQIEFGDATASWDFDGAMELAEKIRVDGYGQAEDDGQIDLEDAIAEAGDDDDLPASVLALATSGAPPIADSAEA